MYRTRKQSSARSVSDGYSRLSWARSNKEPTGLPRPVILQPARRGSRWLPMGIFLLVLAGMCMQHHIYRKLQGPPCNPLEEPGTLHYDELEPALTYWRPFTGCKPSKPWMKYLKYGEWRHLKHLRDKTILIIGDSVDRNALVQMAQLTGHDYYVSSYVNATSHDGDRDPTWDPRGLPWHMHVKALNLTIVNAFMYGMDDNDVHASQPDWHGPGLAEARIREFFSPHTWNMHIDLISLHSGLWDLAYFGRLDKAQNASTEAPLDTAQTTWWIKRITSTVLSVRAHWPGAPVVMRGLHRVGLSAAAAREASIDFRPDDSHAGFVNFFTDIRTQQIRQLQRTASRALEMPYFDFGSFFEGYQQFQNRVHPDRDHGGIVYGMGLLHYAKMLL